MELAQPDHQGPGAPPAWARCLPDAQAAVATYEQLRGEWGPVEAAVDAMSGRRSSSAGDSSEKQQREALLKVHQRLLELGQQHGTAYGAAFEAYMLHAAGRLERERGGDAAAAALLGAVVFAIDAQQEPGAPAALRSMLAPAASVAAAVLSHAQQQKPPARLALSGLMTALAALLLDCSKLDLAAFTADLGTAEAALRCAVAAGCAAATRGNPPQRSRLWRDLLPAAFKAIRKLDDMDEHALLEGDKWQFVRACGALLGLALSATENLRLDVSLSDALAPLDRQEVAQGAVTLAHQLGCCYRDRLANEPPPDEQTQAKLGEVLGWLSKSLQLLSMVLQHGGQMEAFLDDGGVMSLCLHLSKYPSIHAELPPSHAAHAVDCQVVELLTYALNNSKRARELLTEGDQGSGGSGIKILLAALSAAPGLQTLLVDAVVHSQLSRWTFKRSLLKCLEAAVLTTSDHRKEILANDGVGVIVRSCRWRPADAAFKPKQEAQLVRANPAFVRGIAGNAFSCLCIASQNLDDDKSYWNQVASKLAEATSADELMSFHKWMPAGQDTAQALLNADKLSCSWGLHTALWRLLHPLTYNNKDQRAVFAANGDFIRVAAAALSLPNSDEALTKGRVCAFKPTVMYILYNAAIIDDACRKQQLQLGVHERALELLCQSFQMAGEQDRRILKAAATSKRNKGSSAAIAAAAVSGAKDAKTFQAGVGGQADAASLLLEGLLLKSDTDTQSLCRQLTQQGRLAAVQKALNNRIGSSYSESTLQTAERSFLKVLRHAELAVAEQRQQQQQTAAAEAERLATELLAAEEQAAAKTAARAAKQQQQQQQQQQRQRAARQPQAAAAASSSGTEAGQQQQQQPAQGQAGKGDGGGGGGGAVQRGGGAHGTAPTTASAVAAAVAADAQQQQQQQQEREQAAAAAVGAAAAVKEAEQQQGYRKLLVEWEAAEAAAAADAAAVVAARKRGKKQQQREKAKDKKQQHQQQQQQQQTRAAAAAAAAGPVSASMPAASFKAAGRAGGSSSSSGAKVLAVPLNGSRPGSASSKGGSPVAAAAAAPAAAKLGARPLSNAAAAAAAQRPGSAGAAAAAAEAAGGGNSGSLPSRAGLLQQPLASRSSSMGSAGSGAPMSFAAAAAAGTGQTVGPPPSVLPVTPPAATAAQAAAAAQADVAAAAAAAAANGHSGISGGDVPPPTPPRPPPPPAATAPASRASTPLLASPLLLSPQRPPPLACAAAAQQQQQQPHTPPRVLRAASAPALPAIGAAQAAASAPSSVAASVAASPQRSLFADMLQPLGTVAAEAAAASAPQSGTASGVASPQHSVLLPPLQQQQHMQPAGSLSSGGTNGGAGSYAFGGLGGLVHHHHHQQQQQQQHAHQQQQPGYLQQRQQQQQQQLLGSLTPSALEAAILSKARPQPAAGPTTPAAAAAAGGDEDGLDLLPFAVAEAALFDDSPAAAHALPLAVAGFVLGDSDSAYGGGGGLRGLRDIQGSDYSDMLSQMLPGGSPLKQQHPSKAAAAGGRGQAGMNGTIHHPRGDGSNGGAPGSSILFGAAHRDRQQQQQLSMAAAAAWGPRSNQSSLDSSSALTAAGGGNGANGANGGGGGTDQGQGLAAGGSSGGSSGSEQQQLLPGLSRYQMADGNSYERSGDSWFERKGRQLV